MKKELSKTKIHFRKIYSSNRNWLLCLPKEHLQYLAIDGGDTVAVLQNRAKEPVVLKDGDIVVRRLKDAV